MNVQHLASIAIFAEDVRDETQGTSSLIGIFPDNINYNIPESSDLRPQFTKFIIYVRTILSNDDKLNGDISIELISPSGKSIHENVINLEFIEEKRLEAINLGAPQTTLISQFKFAPFPILENGKFEVITKHNGSTFLAGFLNINSTTEN